MHGHLDLDLIFLCSGQQIVTWNWESHNLFISNKDTPSWTSLWKGCLSRIDSSPTETPPVSKLYSSLKCSVTQNVLLPRLDISLILTTMKLEIFFTLDTSPKCMLLQARWTHPLDGHFFKMDILLRWTLHQDGHACVCKDGHFWKMDISLRWTSLYDGHFSEMGTSVRWIHR